MKKRKGFFDDVYEPEISDNGSPDAQNAADGDEKVNLEVNTASVSDVDACENTDKEQSQDVFADEKTSGKKKNVLIFSSIAVIIASFIVVSIAYGMGLFNGKYSDGDQEGSAPKEEFYFYPADYETDIFTVPEYLNLDRRIKYSPDNSQSYLLKNGDYSSEGEPGLVIIGEYLNAAIAGDHEKINSLYTEDYLKENKPHEKFPPQKLFEIKIRKVKEDIRDTGESVYIFVVSYKIFRNDGLFRNNVDETRETAQLFEVIVYPDESGKINTVKDAPGYKLDI